MQGKGYAGEGYTACGHAGQGVYSLWACRARGMQVKGEAAVGITVYSFANVWAVYTFPNCVYSPHTRTARGGYTVKSRNTRLVRTQRGVQAERAWGLEKAAAQEAIASEKAKLVSAQAELAHACALVYNDEDKCAAKREDVSEVRSALRALHSLVRTLYSLLVVLHCSVSRCVLCSMLAVC